MKDRLIELLTAFEMDVRLRCPKYEAPACEGCQYDLDRECDKTAILTDYLLSNGVIVPPLKLGQICYKPYEYRNEIDECRVSSITQKADGSFKTRFTDLRGGWGFEITTDEIGKNVFLTKEEAEKELERRKK